MSIEFGDATVGIAFGANSILFDELFTISVQSSGDIAPTTIELRIRMELLEAMWVKAKQIDYY